MLKKRAVFSLLTGLWAVDVGGSQRGLLQAAGRKAVLLLKLSEGCQHFGIILGYFCQGFTPSGLYKVFGTQ
jgi:hypothetical protein